MKTNYYIILGVGIICLILFASYYGSVNTDDSDSYDYEQSVDDSSYSGFSSETDVRTYLCSHRFISRDGLKLIFRSNAYSAYINGTQITSTTDISLINEGRALIRTHGPYGNTTLVLTISSSGDGIIQDNNSGDVYVTE